MFPLRRFLITIFKAKYAQPIAIDEQAHTRIRCWPWDLDLFFELNNGKALSLYDLGRFDLAIKTPFMRVLKANNWGFVVAGSTIRYRKRIRAFDHIEMRSQMIGYDERWLYIEQSMWVKGQPCSSILLRTGVTSKGKVIAPEIAKKAMGIEHLELIDSPFLESWKASEAIRPWPPK